MNGMAVLPVPEGDWVIGCIHSDYVQGRIDEFELEERLHTYIVDGRLPDGVMGGLPPVKPFDVDTILQ